MIETPTLLSKTYLDNDTNIIDKYTYYDNKFIINLISNDEASIGYNKHSKYAYHLIDGIPSISISNKELNILRNLNIKKLNFELLDLRSYNKEILDFSDFDLNIENLTVEHDKVSFSNLNGTIKNLRLIYRNSFTYLEEPLRKIEDIISGFKNVKCDTLIISEKIYKAIVKCNTIIFDKFKPKTLRTGALPKRHQLFNTKFKTNNYHEFFMNHPELECEVIYYNWWSDKYIYLITKNPSIKNSNIDNRGFYLERIKSDEYLQINPFLCC